MAALLLFFLVSATPRPYDLELEAFPGRVFPSFSEFGTVEIHVYPGGVRADSAFLNGFSRTGSSSLTLMNPLIRMYTDMPMSEITQRIARKTRNALGTPTLSRPTKGKVGSFSASRYRLSYSATEWIDIWMTAEVPENAQFRTVMDTFIRGLSEPTSKIVRTLPGTPVYVELNVEDYRKVAMLQPRGVTWNNAGEREAMRVGSFYVRVPLLDAIWR